MLVQFSVSNYKTFREKAVFSLVASNYDKKEHEDSNIFIEKDTRLLRSAVIYGANASGKTKFLEALAFMRHFIYESSKDSQKGQKIDVEPFLFNEETENSPSEFEIIFNYKNIQYRYGFEVTKQKVISEWFYQRRKIKEVEIFYREEKNIEFHKTLFSQGKFLWEKGMVRDNALLISVATQFNDEEASNITIYLNNYIKTISGISEEDIREFTLNKMMFDEKQSQIVKMLKAVDIGIEDLKIEAFDKHNLPDDMPNDFKEFVKENNVGVLGLKTYHRKYDEQQQFIKNEVLPFGDESAGTQKYLALTGPILDVLENGHTLVVDEMDSKLHPNLVEGIVKLFNSKDINKNNAQLIFNTHNTNLLTADLFRRDQIWFTEKNQYGEASLYSLADFKGVRKTDAFENNYLKGKYGAVPFIDFESNINISMKENGKEK